jgi:hypothetical protein
MLNNMLSSTNIAGVILRIDVINNINKFNLATVFTSIKRLSKKKPGQVTFF